MKVFLEGELRGVMARERVDPTTGDKTTKYRTFIENEDGERLELNAKTDYSDLKRKAGVAQIGVYDREGGGYWLTLLEFVPQDID